MKLNLFASCAPGLESLLLTELQQLSQVIPSEHRPGDCRHQQGGVQFHGDEVTLAYCLIGLGLASRILARIAIFPVRHLQDLESHMKRLPWSGWLVRDVPRQIRVTSRKSKLYHTGAIAQRILSGIQERLGDQPPSLVDTESERPPEGADQHSVERDSVHLVARLEHDQCTLSLDTSGAPLHRRGYRQNPAHAPLREDLARALVMVSGWTGQMPLLDPLCGSGTVLLEAAILATRRPPGRDRTFGIEATVLGQGDHLRQAAHSLDQQVIPLNVPLEGSDQDPRAISAATANAQRLGWERLGVDLHWHHRTVQQTIPPSQRVQIITNPPWGGRVMKAEGFRQGTRQRDVAPALRQLYWELGQLRKRCAAGSQLTLLTSRRALAYQTTIPMPSAFLTDAGGIKVNAFVESQATEPDPEVRSADTF